MEKRLTLVIILPHLELCFDMFFNEAHVIKSESNGEARNEKLKTQQNIKVCCEIPTAYIIQIYCRFTQF